MTFSRVAVIGDVGGHLDELCAELVRLGADPQTGRLPTDLLVIQVGDLIHRGPASAGVIELVAGYLSEQPQQWVQLVGNHEAQYLRDAAFEWPERLDDLSVARLRGWWREGQLRVAAGFATDDGDYLVTHAGLTAGYWRDVLARPGDARRAVEALGTLATADADVLFRAGAMLGFPISQAAGPLWASAPTELLPSWAKAPLPFHQIHGHSSAYDWRRERFLAGETLAQASVVDAAARHVTTRLDGGHVIGIDPGHGRRPRRPWRAWVSAAHELAIP